MYIGDFFYDITSPGDGGLRISGADVGNIQYFSKVFLCQMAYQLHFRQ